MPSGGCTPLEDMSLHFCNTDLLSACPGMADIKVTSWLAACLAGWLPGLLVG